MESFKTPLLIFDPKCSLCLRVKRLLALIDRENKVQLVSLYAPELFEAFDNLSFDECYGKVHLIDEDNVVHVGADAVEFLLTNLSPFNKVPFLWQREGVRVAMRLGYELLNTYRLKHAPPCERCRP